MIPCREKEKKKKKGADADAESGGDSPGSPGEDGAAEEGEVVWMTDTSEQAAKDRAQAQLTKAMADMVTQVSLDLGSNAAVRSYVLFLHILLECSSAQVVTCRA